MAKKSVAVNKSKEKKPAAAPAPAPANVWDPFNELRARMDHLFDDFGAGWGLPGRFAEGRGFGPMAWPFAGEGKGLVDVKVEVTENDKAMQIDAELPGLEEKDVDVSLSDDVLTIKGEKKVEREEEEKDYKLTERRYGSFTRSFRLPDSIDDAKIKAQFDKGVLKITLPKKPGTKAAKRKIQVSKS